MRSLFALSFLPLALSSVIPRDLLPNGQTVKQDVINIHNAVLDLNATPYNAAPFPTSIIEGVPILLGVTKIHLVNRAGWLHAIAAQPFSAQDTNQIIDTVVSTVNVSIPAATETIIKQAAAYKQGGLGTAVIASLKLLQSDHDTFSARVLEKSNQGVGAAKMKEGVDAVANIHNAIQTAIDYFNANA